MLLEDFKNKCQSGGCLRNTVKSPQCKKQYKQEQCFAKYIKSLEKKKEEYEQKKEEYIEQCINQEWKYKKDEKWDELRAKVLKRDNNECQFYSKCSDAEKKILDVYLKNKVMKTLDLAHYLPRGRFPQFRLDEDVVFILFRYIHFCLDNYINPFTNEKCTKEEIETFWKRIIPDETYAELQEKKSRGSENI